MPKIIGHPSFRYDEDDTDQDPKPITHSCGSRHWFWDGVHYICAGCDEKEKP